jgi:hypothetical protein
MTVNQMAAFEAKLSELKEALVYVAYPSKAALTPSPIHWADWQRGFATIATPSRCSF